METIEVRYSFSDIGPDHNHKYIIYTNSNGEQFYASGGPEITLSLPERVVSAPFSETPAGYLFPPFGNITTDSGKYVEGGPEWVNPNLPADASEEVKRGGDLSEDWAKIVEAMRDIKDEKHPYRAATQNSNTTVDEALRRSNIPLPQNDDPGENYSPGSGNILDPRNTWEKIKDTAKKWWDNARDWIRPRIDPLTLDLDGDGIETIGVNADNHILFDHDGDGAKHGTGWVSADDAMLVLDRNNNGTIDSGRELFGDNTQLSNGHFAADGFAALANIDSNGDGKISNTDTQFSNLRLWRDLNQDGVSQANELFTLSDYNITSINLAKTENTTTLANGNQIADLGTFTKTDAVTGEVTTGNMADVNLLNDRFNRCHAEHDSASRDSDLRQNDKNVAANDADLREAATMFDLGRMQLFANRFAHHISQAQTLRILAQSLIHHGLVVATTGFSTLFKLIQHRIIYPHGDARFAHHFGLQFSQNRHIFSPFGIGKIIFLAHNISSPWMWLCGQKSNVLFLHRAAYNKPLINLNHLPQLTATLLRQWHQGLLSPKPAGQAKQHLLHQMQHHASLHCLPLSQDQIQYSRPYNMHISMHSQDLSCFIAAANDADWKIAA